MVSTQPAARSNDCNRRLIVYFDRALRTDYGATAVGDLPFQCIGGQPFIRVSLPDETPELVVAFCPFAILDGLCHAFELIPCGGRSVETVLLQQVGAVVEHTEANAQWQGDQAAVDRVVQDQGRQIRIDLLLRDELVHVEQVFSEQTGPDDVDANDIEVGAFGLKSGEVDGQQVLNVGIAGDAVPR